jgi:hypothetical protein
VSFVGCIFQLALPRFISSTYQRGREKSVLAGAATDASTEEFEVNRHRSFGAAACEFLLRGSFAYLTRPRVVDPDPRG